MNAWAAVLLAGVGSYTYRVGILLVIDRWTLPSWFERATRLVMPAVFAGLAAASLSVPVTDDVATSVPVLLAGATTAAVAVRHATAAAMAAGMVVIWLANLVVG